MIGGVGGEWDGLRRLASRDGGDHAGFGERLVLYGGPGPEVGEKDGQPGRRFGVSPVLRGRVGEAGDGDHLLRLARFEARPEPRGRGRGLGDGFTSFGPGSARVVDEAA